MHVLAFALATITLILSAFMLVCSLRRITPHEFAVFVAAWPWLLFEARQEEVYFNGE